MSPNIKQKQISKVQILLNNLKLDKANKEALRLLDIDSNNIAILKLLVEINVVFDDLDKQEKYILKLIKIEPTNPSFCNDLAGVYTKLHKYNIAKEMYLKAIEYSNGDSDMYANLANLYHKIKDYDKAEELFNLAYANNDWQETSKISYSMFLLENKKYILGFDLYRNRHLKNQSELLSQDKVLKKGTNIQGKRIYLTSGQGPGDMIIFMRYINIFEKMGATVFIKPKKDLYRLFDANYPHIIIKDNHIDVDYHLPLIDAAYFFETEYDNIPYSEGFLTVKKDDSTVIYNKYFKGVSKKKIGIVWKSNPTKSETASRSRARSYKSATLELFIKYFNTDEVQLYSLQYAVCDEDRKILENNNIMSLGDEFEDFYDNALVIDNLDSVITIETASLILAGAMGKEAVGMVHYNAFWLWGRDDKHTNWFNSIRLARKTSLDDWDSAFKNALKIENLLSIPFNEIMQRAIQLHRIGDIKAAEELYRKILSVEPNNADAYHYLGVIASQTGNIEQAIALINHSITLNPNLLEAKENLQKILMLSSEGM